MLKEKNIKLNSKYNLWTVIGIGENRKYKSCTRSMLICECECGTIKEVDKSAVITGRSKNCGCKGSYLTPGQTFNEWTVLKKVEYRNKHNNQFYLCKCSCGAEREVRMSDLTNNSSKNCGHDRATLSKGAQKIKRILEEASIQFYMEYIFKDLPNRRYDFALYDKNNHIIRLIEYDGEQHSPNSHSSWASEDLQKRDLEKNKYALKNNIPLVRISWWKEDLDLKDLLENEFEITEKEV